jgi:hypothetical protein
VPRWCAGCLSGLAFASFASAAVTSSCVATRWAALFERISRSRSAPLRGSQAGESFSGRVHRRGVNSHEQHLTDRWSRPRVAVLKG